MEDRDILKAMRKEANMMQRQFARYFGVPTRTIGEKDIMGLFGDKDAIVGAALGAGFFDSSQVK